MKSFMTGLSVLATLSSALIPLSNILAHELIFIDVVSSTEVEIYWWVILLSCKSLSRRGETKTQNVWRLCVRKLWLSQRRENHSCINSQSNSHHFEIHSMLQMCQNSCQIFLKLIVVSFVLYKVRWDVFLIPWEKIYQPITAKCYSLQIRRIW